jgi:hypothetical protein
VLSLGLMSAAVAVAQDSGGRMASVTDEAPMYWRRDNNRTPMRVLRSGTDVRVLSRTGGWYQVVYTDPRYGDEVGFVEIGHFHADGRPTTTAGITQRGYLEGRVAWFPQAAPNDDVPAVADGLFRDEVFLRPSRWLQLAAGLDIRENSHDQESGDWRLDLEDRTTERPYLALRRLSASVTTRHVTLDVGKQFIRWGRADILSPTDRFAPRDYLNVIDTEFLPVTGVRLALSLRSETFEGVWLPQMTPSRAPLLTQRWTVAPPEAAGLTIVDGGAVFPSGSEQGFRWSHAGRFEAGLSFFEGFNHLPDLNPAFAPGNTIVPVGRTYPALRSYGGELALPMPLFTLKSEAALFTSPDRASDEYVLYVVELERQIGEWLIDGGYAGEIVTETRPGAPFAAERGVAKSILGRAAYTVDPRRTVAVEAAARQDGAGLYAKAEYTQSFGQHWRTTFSGVSISGNDDDFLGQYHRNSHLSVTLRLSF